MIEKVFSVGRNEALRGALFALVSGKVCALGVAWEIGSDADTDHPVVDHFLQATLNHLQCFLV